MPTDSKTWCSASSQQHNRYYATTTKGTKMGKQVMICGVDCRQGDENCNGYCTGKTDSPPVNPKRTVLYTIVDLNENVRGTENLIFGCGAETRQQCEEMLIRLEGRSTNLGFKTEVSHRNRVPLKVTAVITANAKLCGGPLSGRPSEERTT